MGSAATPNGREPMQPSVADVEQRQQLSSTSTKLVMVPISSLVTSENTEGETSSKTCMILQTPPSLAYFFEDP